MLRTNIEINRAYGWLTVLGEAERDKFNHIRYLVRCRCGKEYIVPKYTLNCNNRKCIDCTRKNIKAVNTAKMIGKHIANWKVLAEVPTAPTKAQKFRCICTNCNTVSIRTKYQISHGKTGKCMYCPPNYSFIVNDDFVIGTLPDGTEFLIDREDIEKVASMRWHFHPSSKYVVNDSRKSKRISLHRFLLGVENSTLIVDHINRNTLDCRKSNLRVVTAQQNCMNVSKRRNNTTGYIGVSYVKSHNIYRAQISLNDRDISLGRSQNPILCAQIYNYASQLLHGDYCGERNDVPEPTQAIQEKIYNVCLPYMQKSKVATQAVPPFLYNKK